MKVKQIAFLGDSFTWGEGLELYLDTPFWIEQRKKKSTWPELIKIQTDESVSFREKNRFAGIVSEYFESEIIIDKRNGGNINTISEILSDIIKKNLKPDFIIIQFSSFNRNPIHFHLGQHFKKCNCDKCNCDKWFGDKNIIPCFFHLLNTVQRKYGTLEVLNDEDLFYINWLNDEFQFRTLELNHSKDSFITAFHYINLIIDSYSHLHLNYLVNKYIKPLEERGIKVFYIDSWDTESSKICHLIPSINENMISLGGWGNSTYTKNYNQFETSFPYTRIQHEFRKTNNEHPTLIQHQHIANSIISKIENFDKKSFFQKLF